MPKAGFKFPELTPKQRDTDELGALREQIKKLQDDAKKIENRLRKCVGKTFHGNFFDSKIYESANRSLSRTKLLKYMTAKQLDACYIDGDPKITVKTTRRQG